MPVKTKGLLYLALLSIIFGSTFLLIKLAEKSIPPIAITTGRMAIGALCTYVFLRIRGERMPPIGREWLHFLFLGAFSALIPYTLLSFAETEISSGLTAVLVSMMPILTVLIAYLWIGEPLTRDKSISVVLGFIGVIIILLPTLLGGMKANLIGSSAALLVALITAFSTIYIHKYLKDVSPAVTVTGMMAIAAILGLPLVIIFENPAQIKPTPESLLALVVMGILSSAIGMMLYFWLIANRGPAYASLVRFTSTPVAVLLAAEFMDAAVQWTTIAGMLFILLSIAIMTGYMDRFLWRKG